MSGDGLRCSRVGLICAVLKPLASASPSTQDAAARSVCAGPSQYSISILANISTAVDSSPRASTACAAR